MATAKAIRGKGCQGIGSAGAVGRTEAARRSTASGGRQVWRCASSCASVASAGKRASGRDGGGGRSGGRGGGGGGGVVEEWFGSRQAIKPRCAYAPCYMLCSMCLVMLCAAAAKRRSMDRG